MGFTKLIGNEKNKINIIKSYLLLYPYWLNELNSIKDNYTRSILLNNILFIDRILLEDEKNNLLVNKSLITKNKGLEYIAYTMYYSESGLRNQLNIVCKKILNKLEKENIFDHSNLS